MTTEISSSLPTRHPSLVITGFMGTGKTSVGRVVAAKLQREFVDMDAVIEAREGTSVETIFKARGEEYFRAREAELCSELAARENLVIATGGGALVNPHQRAAFASAMVVCLDAAPEKILARLGRALDRPLLASADPRRRVEELLAARRAAYAQIQWHVDTTDKTVQQVAEEILARFQMQSINVPTPDGAYRILVGASLLGQVGGWVSERSSAERFSARCAIITNPRVGELHAARVLDSLRANGFAPRVIEIPDGEEFKTLDTVRRIYDQLIDAQLDRRSIIFALGGGVVGDIAGFAAATFLRGVPFVQLPTTLLAMVDASIGGKVAVDHPRGKNLIGAFKQPRAVIADTETLATLPAAEFRSGMAEVVKHAIIGDAGLFEELGAGNWKLEVGGWIVRAMRVKVDIVARDPFEQGERAKLNLGHTFGHAFEMLSNYQLRHGDGVAIGLVCAVRVAARRQLCDERFAARIARLLRAIALPTRVPRHWSTDAILEAMATDKKRVDVRLRFVLPRAPGDVLVVDDVTREDLAAAIEESRE